MYILASSFCSHGIYVLAPHGPLTSSFFRCGLVKNVDECLAAKVASSDIPNFEYRPNQRFVCLGQDEIMLGLSDAPLPVSAPKPRTLNPKSEAIRCR